MVSTIRPLLAALGTAVGAAAVAAPALAAPLLIIAGDDTTVTALNLGARERSGDVRQADVYYGAIAEGSRARSVVGERHAYDCPARRERVVGILSPRSGQGPAVTKAEGPWKPIAWKSPADYAITAVCLNIYDDDRVSSKPDIPAILDSLERVWRPGPTQPPPSPQAAPPRERPWWRPF